MEKYKILIIEDNQEIIEVIELYKPDNYVFLKAYDGEEGIDLFMSENPDVVILDLMLPKIDGYGVLKYIRERSAVPVIILSAKKLDEEIIFGLKKGADDYMTKPFNASELMARIEVLIRRFSRKDLENKICVGNFTLNKNSCELYRGNKLISLTAKEYKLMEFFMDNSNRVLTKRQILDSIWADEYYDDNIVTVYISRLRDKIEDNPKKPEHIITFKGLGYKFQ